jgi:hypothetical protein
MQDGQVVSDIFMGPTRVDFAAGFIERNQCDANKASWRPPFISKQAVELRDPALHPVVTTRTQKPVDRN